MEPQIEKQQLETPLIPLKQQTSQTNGSLIIIMSILLIISVAIAGLFYFQIQRLSKDISKNQIQASVTPSATISPTADWKTQSSDIFSFKYPSNLFLEERQKNYFVLLTDFENPSSVFVSIDARLAGSYINYDKAIESTKEGLTEIQTQNIENGIKISGLLGPGYGQGQQITIALFKYMESAIGAETTATESSKLQIFDQILSTFKFVEKTPTALPKTNTPSAIPTATPSSLQ